MSLQRLVEDEYRRRGYLGVEPQDSPLRRLEVIRDLRRDLEVMEREAAAEARRVGRTWQQIADAAGLTSKQGAQQRYRPAPAPTPPAGQEPLPGMGTATPAVDGRSRKAGKPTDPGWTVTLAGVEVPLVHLKKRR